MKILVVAPTPFFSDRGCHIRIYQQMKALQQKGHEVLVVTYGTGNNVSGVRTARIPKIVRRNAFFGQPLFQRVIFDVLMIWKVFFTRQIYRPDIIHCYLHSGFLIGYIASFFSARKIIFDCQGSLTQEMQENGWLKKSLSRRIISSVEKFIYRKARVITVSSDTIKREIQEQYNADPRKITVIPDCPPIDISTENKKNQISPTALREQLAVPKNKKLIIYTGVLSKSAGIDIFLEAIKMLTLKRDDFFVLILGYPDVERYEEAATKLNIQNDVRFLGRIDYFKLPDYLALSDIAVAPKISTTEAHGKIVNYLAAGLPVVCFHSVINEEIGGQYLLYAEHKTPTSLADALTYALQHSGELSQHKEERKKFIRDRYSWQTNASLIEKIYHKLLHYEHVSRLQ